MNRIDSYEDLAEQIVNWIKDYYWDNDLGGLVVGVSGGIDSAVVSTLCARTGLPTYILTMPLDSKKENTELSDAHAEFLKNKYPNIKLVAIDGFLKKTHLFKKIWIPNVTLKSKRDFKNKNSIHPRGHETIMQFDWFRTFLTSMSLSSLIDSF